MEIKVTKSKKFIGFLLGFFLLASSSLSYGAVINVPTPAYPTIQDGIDAAFDGDTVLVADGTFTGSGNRNLDFGGKAINVESSGGPENCIIDLEDTNNRGFYFHSGEDENSVVSGFTIRGSRLDPDSGFDRGGGIFIAENSGPTITNCIIKENSGGYEGGGIYSAGPAIISDCRISGNYAYGYAGGLDISGGTIVSNCNISNNRTSNVGTGGGLYTTGYVRIINCTIDSNSTGEGSGGGIVTGSNADIINCTISNNSAYDFGGGVRIYGSPNIIGCNISGNFVAFYGGGIFIGNSSSPTISKCSINNNIAGDYGSGICIIDSSPIIENSIIYNNEGYDGVYIGIFDESGSSFPIITNCTIVYNYDRDGGPGVGIYTDSDNPSSIILENSILWGHEGRYQIAPYFDFDFVTYNDIDQDGFDGVNGNIRQDPLFVDPDNGDFHLQKQSPCIDAGTSDGAPDDDIDEDQRPQGSGYDMGADEFVFVTNKKGGGGGGGGG